MVSEVVSGMLRQETVRSLTLGYSELAFRLSLYIVMAPLSGAASGLLASAILKLNHFGSTKGWQMIFAIEGVATIVLALVALLIMTDRPETVGRLH
jgi:sugar phosphate permease